MKIAYAVHHLPPRYTGGAEARALRTASWFQAHQHAASIICIEAIDQSDPPVADAAADGVFVRRLVFDLKAAPDPERWRYDNPLVERRVGEFLAQQQPDVFHLFSGYLMTAGAVRAARAAGVPIVISLTDFWFLCPRITLLRGDGSVCPAPPVDALGCVRCMAEEQRRFRLPARAAPGVVTALWRAIGRLPSMRDQARHIRERRRILRDALDYADALICPSRFLKELFAANGAAPDKLILMRQGLSLPKHRPVKERDRGLPVIGYRGQIKPHKGLDVLVDAALDLAARGHRFTLALYGNADEDARYTASLKRRAAGAAFIEWRGTYPASRVWEVLAGLDVAVVPSRWYENSPNAILEAQAAGVPVVATDLGGMAELVRHDVDGLLFKLNDPIDLSRQLARLLEEPALRERLSAQAPPVRTLDDEMAELVKLYRRVALREPASATLPSKQTEASPC